MVAIFQEILLVHRLDARAKLIFVFFLLWIVFLANNGLHMDLLLVFTFCYFNYRSIRLYFLINGLKPVVILIVFTFLLHVVVYSRRRIIFEWKFFKIYEEGLKQGIFISIRFLVLVFYTSILTLTTYTYFDYRWY